MAALPSKHLDGRHVDTKKEDDQRAPGV